MGNQGVINHAPTGGPLSQMNFLLHTLFCLSFLSQGVINHAPTRLPVSMVKIHHRVPTGDGEFDFRC